MSANVYDLPPLAGTKVYADIDAIHEPCESLDDIDTEGVVVRPSNGAPACVVWTRGAPMDDPHRVYVQSWASRTWFTSQLAATRAAIKSARESAAKEAEWLNTLTSWLPTGEAEDE